MTQGLWLVALIGGLLLLVEAAFRVFLMIRGIRFSPPKTYRHLYILPHPYLPYVYKANTVVGNVEIARYPLHPGRFEFRPVRINNVRGFHEDVLMPKEPGMRRIMCLGGSTTANSMWEVGNPEEYSYPLCLRASLARRPSDTRYEVLNCGAGGWTSAEIFVNFSLHLIDLQPDLVVLYHGFNDLEASLTAPFSSDYSHSRKNFGETYTRIRLASYLPNLGFWKSYAFLKGRAMGFGNVRYDLVSSIRAGKADLDNPFMGLEAERRNVRHLIHLCKANNIQIILSTFAYHVYDAVSQDRRALKYRDGVKLENAMVQALAKEYDLPLVDIAGLIPDDNDYFVDSVHFTPRGMQFLADQFADKIVDVLAPLSASQTSA